MRGGSRVEQLDRQAKRGFGRRKGQGADADGHELCAAEITFKALTFCLL